MSSSADDALAVAEAWAARATHHHSEWSAQRIAAERVRTVSVCLPARNEASTIGAILDALEPLRAAGAIDQLIVVDDSTDDTAAIAKARGAEVHDQSSLRPEYGPVQGKGDAMWRALTVATGDVVCFVDADSEGVGPHFACGLVGPVALPGSVQMAKAFYRRPFRTGESSRPTGGGRVTELTARPLLNAFFPQLTGFRQPLAGEFAARRELLERLPFLCGYAVDVGLLIDAWRAVGLDGLVQVDLDVRQNRHRPLEDLRWMAHEVTSAIMQRAHEDGQVRRSPPQAMLVADGEGVASVACPLVERSPVALARPVFAERM